MENNSKKMRIGTIMCWVLIAVVFLIVLISMLYNSFLNNYNIQKLEDYLYTAECSRYNYGLIGKMLDANLITPGCSTVRKGDIVGRNFDWTYDENADFIVMTPAAEGRHQTIGVSSISGIEEKTASNFRYTISYNLLPFYAVDGINDQGLFACVNEVPSGDAGYTTGTNPGGERLCTAIAVRYILDYADNVDQAIRILREKDLFSYEMDEGPYEVHFMLSDPEKNAVVEIVNNQVVVVEDCNIMTNFYVSMDEYTPYAEGIERYDILTAAYDGITDEESMRELLKTVYYSKLYDPSVEPVWYSETYGDHVSASGEEFTYYSDLADFPNAMDEERAGYENRVRDGHFWQTCHSCVYNLEDMTLSVSAQEHDKVYDFVLTPVSEIEAQKQENSNSRKIMVPLDCLCALILLMLLFAMLFENKIMDKKSRCFTWLVLSTLLAILIDIGAWMFDGMPTHAFLNGFFNYLAIIIADIIAAAFIWYEYYFLIERKEVPMRPAILLSVFECAAIVTFTVLWACGKLFSIVDGVFFQTDAIYLSIGVSAVNIVVMLYTVIHSRRILGVHDTVAFAAYGFIPLLVALYEIVHPTVEIAFIAVVIAVFLVYIMLQAGKTNALKMRQELLEEICYVDQLTDLDNRRAYDEALDRSSDAESSGVIFCDVNGLKYANDHFGHKAGDTLLVKFADILLNHFDKENVFRISGDEFVVILSGLKENEFEEALERFRKAAFENGDIAAVGGCFSAEQSAAQLIADAEKQMYKAKAEFYERHPEYDRRKKPAGQQV